MSQLRMAFHWMAFSIAEYHLMNLNLLNHQHLIHHLFSLVFLRLFSIQFQFSTVLFQSFRLLFVPLFQIQNTSTFREKTSFVENFGPFPMLERLISDLIRCSRAANWRFFSSSLVSSEGQFRNEPREIIFLLSLFSLFWSLLRTEPLSPRRQIKMTRAQMFANRSG